MFSASSYLFLLFLTFFLHSFFCQPFFYSFLPSFTSSFISAIPFVPTYWKHRLRLIRPSNLNDKPWLFFLRGKKSLMSLFSFFFFFFTKGIYFLRHVMAPPGGLQTQSAMLIRLWIAYVSFCFVVCFINVCFFLSIFFSIFVCWKLYLLSALIDNQEEIFTFFKLAHGQYRQWKA